MSTCIVVLHITPILLLLLLVSEGGWSHGLKHGHGSLRWADGGGYEGLFAQDLMNGQGSCTFKNGDVYIGDWKDDLRHGKSDEFV